MIEIREDPVAAGLDFVDEVVVEEAQTQQQEEQQLAAGGAFVKIKGRISQTKNYTSANNLQMLNTARHAGAYISSVGGPKWQQFWQEFSETPEGRGRTKESLHTHVTEMKKSVMSAISNLSEGSDKQKSPDDLENTEENSAYFEKLYQNMLGSGGSPKSWWSQEVVTLLALTQLRFQQTSGLNKPQTLTAIEQSKQASIKKFAQDTANKEDLVKKRKEEFEEEKRDAKKYKDASIQQGIDSLLVLNKLADAAVQMMSPVTPSPNAEPPSRLTEDVTLVRNEVGGLSSKVDAIETKMNNMETSMKEGFALLAGLLAARPQNA